MLGERGISLRSVQDSIDPTTTNGRHRLNLVASLAEYERHLSSERIAAGMTAARQAGTKFGRPPVDPDAVNEKLRVVEQARARGLTAADAAQLVGWSRATLYRHQQQHGSQP
jgi:DNA invertase Pin-like site-specific DNA recombinase